MERPQEVQKLFESSPLFQLLQELTARDILKDVDPKSKARSAPLSSTFLRFKGNVVSFRTTSGTTKGLFWLQTLQLVGLRKQLDLVRDGKTTLLKAVRAAVLDGDIKVHCNCPAQKWWGWAYISTELGFKYGRKQKIFPSIRNPRLKGTVCKHLINVLGTLPFNVSTMVKKGRKRGLPTGP